MNFHAAPGLTFHFVEAKKRRSITAAATINSLKSCADSAAMMGNYANKALLFFFVRHRTLRLNWLQIKQIRTIHYELIRLQRSDSIWRALFYEIFFPCSCCCFLFPVFVCVWNFARFPLNRPNSPPWDFVCSSQWWLHYWALDLFNEFIEAAKIVIFSAECFWKRHCLEICGLKIDTIHYGLKIVQLWINKKPNRFWRVVWKFMMNYY